MCVRWGVARSGSQFLRLRVWLPRLRRLFTIRFAPCPFLLLLFPFRVFFAPFPLLLLFSVFLPMTEYWQGWILQTPPAQVSEQTRAIPTILGSAGGSVGMLVYCVPRMTTPPLPPGT